MTVFDKLNLCRFFKILIVAIEQTLKKNSDCINIRYKINCFCIFQALVKFLAEAHRGIHGFVMDEHGNPVEKASLKIKQRDVGFQTTKYGEFWRILLPGMYKLEVNKHFTLLQKDVDFIYETQKNVDVSARLRI